MKVPAVCFLCFLGPLVLAASGCGSQGPACLTSFNLSINAQAATPVHGTVAPGDQQKFTAYSAPTLVSGACAVPALVASVNATWTTSDPMNTQVDSSPGTTNGLATCLGSTTVPATLTATVTSGVTTRTATATLTCQ